MKQLFLAAFIGSFVVMGLHASEPTIELEALVIKSYPEKIGIQLLSSAALLPEQRTVIEGWTKFYPDESNLPKLTVKSGKQAVFRVFNSLPVEKNTSDSTPTIDLGCELRLKTKVREDGRSVDVTIERKFYSNYRAPLFTGARTGELLTNPERLAARQYLNFLALRQFSTDGTSTTIILEDGKPSVITLGEAGLEAGFQEARLTARILPP